jgi:hypothetical protein
MELLAVRTARLIAHLSVEELNPAGRPLAHNYMQAFVERYSFIKRPTTADEILDTQNKGVTFEVGKWNDVGIAKVVLYDWGVVVETNTSTDASEAILQDMLDWGAETFGMSNRPSLITQRNYLSELVVSSDVSLPAISTHFQHLSNKVTGLVSRYVGKSLPFETTGFSLAFDNTLSKQLSTPFIFQRLADASFSEKKYYSGAPLKTPDHLVILEELEAMLKG